jgi:predicted TIM-barrel fold metal-dependent hydrolase
VIIDVDTHWETDGLDPAEYPLRKWADRFPDSAGRLAHAIAGDLLQALDPADRPEGRTLLPGLVKASDERFADGEVRIHPVHASDSDDRVAWMDRVGIDHCLVNPGGYWQMLEFLPSLDRAEGVRRCNDFLTAQLAPHADRLHAVATVALQDLDEAVHELERARARGARAFFLYTLNGAPPTLEAFGHPAWDKVWRASVDLGMVAIIHVGNTSSDFTGWANVGWRESAGSGVEGLVRIANTQRVHAAQNIISSLLYGGSFARVPDMTVLVAEMRVGWLPFFVRMLETQGFPSAPLGDWPYDVPAGDMLRRNLRITPLPGFGDIDALDVLERLPEMCVFSSDYPHGEGNEDPISLYGDALADLDPDLRTAFLGRNVEAVFARTGQPL